MIPQLTTLVGFHSVAGVTVYWPFLLLHLSNIKADSLTC